MSEKAEAKQEQKAEAVGEGMEVVEELQGEDYPLQTDFLDEFIQQDRWLVIVLDACRYDSLASEIGDVVKPVISPAISTPEWLARAWPNSYDATYISGTPWIHREYRGRQHFTGGVEDVWQYGFDDFLGTVPPQNVARAALNRNDPRMVAHFMQPHMPYIGETEVPSKDLGKQPSVKEAANKVGIKTLREAYRENLQLAFSYAMQLRMWFDGPTVITADHGEMLGEDELFGHNEPDHRLKRLVPWME